MLPKTPAPSAAPAEAEEQAATAVSEPMKEDAQDRVGEEVVPIVQGGEYAQPSGPHDMAIDTPSAADESLADGVDLGAPTAMDTAIDAPLAADVSPADLIIDAGFPTAMDVGRSAEGEEEGTLEAICAADSNAAAGGNAADELPQAAAGAAAQPAPQFYVARTPAQLHAAMGSQAGPAAESTETAADRGAGVPGGSNGPARTPAGGRRGKLMWRPAGQVAEVDPLCMLRVSVHIIGPGVAEEGAALCALAPAEAADIRRAMLRRKTLKGANEGQGQLAAAAQSGRQESVREVLLGRGERDAGAHGQIIGYVTSPGPRGLVRCSFTLSIMMLLRMRWEASPLLHKKQVVYKMPAHHTATITCRDHPAVWQSLGISKILAYKACWAGCSLHGGEQRPSVERMTSCGCASSRRVWMLVGAW